MDQDRFSYDKVLLGLSLIGTAVPRSRADVQQWPLILMGSFDHPIKVACYYQSKQVLPSKDEDLEIAEALNGLEFLKRTIRLQIENAIRHLEMGVERERVREHERLLKDLRAHAKPSEFGTVAEIAQKYGISKSEVRRRKADGTLAAFINSKEQALEEPK